MNLPPIVTTSTNPGIKGQVIPTDSIAKVQLISVRGPCDSWQHVTHDTKQQNFHSESTCNSFKNANYFYICIGIVGHDTEKLTNHAIVLYLETRWFLPLV